MSHRRDLEALSAQRKARPFLATAPTTIVCPQSVSRVLEPGLRTHAFASMEDRDAFVAAHRAEGAFVDSWARLNGGHLSGVAR